MLRFAVVADSHFHPAGEGRPTQAAWGSDAEFNARNAAVVARLAEIGPALVVHLGDVVHPVPGLPEHETALEAARSVYEALPVPLHVVPGNHDVGDKPHPWAPAPSVSPAKHETFRRWWGPPWWSLRAGSPGPGEVRLLGLDTPVLNSGLALEAEQWAWLEAELVADGPRTFVFLHYPPFLLHAAEGEHYDNLAEPARGRLLALFARARVEAVFCGHVHHPFWNRHQGVDYYLLPSTAFVRPEYSELARIGPSDDEFGRNDVERLGFCVVDVDEVGHRVQWVRATAPVVLDAPPRCRFGLTLRNAWDAVADLPASGLEPFRRKRARDDLALLATWELGVPWLRVPLDDLRAAETRARMLAVASKGQRFVLFTADPLTEEVVALLREAREAVEAVELVVPRSELERPLPELPVPRWVSVYGRRPGEARTYFSHFTPSGFSVDDPDAARAGGEGLVFRIEPDEDLASAVAAIGARAAALGRRAVGIVSLPGAGEARAATDDEAVTRAVEEAWRAAGGSPEVRLFLDLTVDHDRGYHPRHGLLDRHHHPRPAFRRLVELIGGEGEGGR
jgi:hypothetical protein